MKSTTLTLPIFLAAAVLSLAGCSFLKPSGVTARYFVLSPTPAAASAPASTSAGTNLSVGVGYVTLPPYLFTSAMQCRSNANEMVRLESAVWSERLDKGLQRVLAANLGAMLPTDSIRLSTWRREDVAVEVYVIVERFDVDIRGRGELVAWWRVLSPGGDKELKSGEFRGVRQGEPPLKSPEGAAATMSTLAGDLSRQLADAIKQATPAKGG